MSASVQARLFEGLPDHASEYDDRALAIDKVGIKDLSYPITVLDKHQAVQHTVARVGLYVSLPQHFKGTHMSRFVEVLNARHGEITIRNLPEILTEIQRRLEADDAHIELTFPYFISKEAPISRVRSLLEVTCAFRASKRASTVDFTLSVRVPVKSLCPCSKAISEYGAHNQRSLVDVEVRSTSFLWIEDIVDAVERCASAPLFALLKREDEKYITELAYENPKFVEDLVRDVNLAIRVMPGVTWLKVSAENQESIHNHSAYAEIEWSADDEADTRQMRLRLVPPPAKEEPLSFGAWLKAEREARHILQQDLAERIGVTAPHLSRVEGGDKKLSEEALVRVAEALGIEPALVMLRAGHLPDALREIIMRSPEEFLSWARA